MKSDAYKGLELPSVPLLGLKLNSLDTTCVLGSVCEESEDNLDSRDSRDRRSDISAAPFHELKIIPSRSDDAASSNCVGSEGDQYSNSGFWSACFRVLVSNPPKGDAKRRARIQKLRESSFLGQNGHIERASALTHLIGAVVFLAFSIARPFLLGTSSVPERLAWASSIVLVFTFGVSTAFHTGGTVEKYTPILRTFDHGAIDVALAVACVADCAVVLDFEGVAWQTILDSVGAATVTLVFFMYRRIILPAADTEIRWGDCRFGLFRVQHADFEYAALRSSGYICLSFAFISLIPAARRNLDEWSSTALILCNGVSLLLLVVGLLFDNLLSWPDYRYNIGKPTTPAMHSRSCGCIVTSHSIWHLFSLVSVVILTIGREFAISRRARDEA